MNFKVGVILPAIMAIVLGVYTLANAQAIRTWVSGVGDDANPCSRTAPCKTFAGAISKTAVGGEIDVLDPGGFGAVTITKSISIEAASVIAGVLVSGTNGIVVNAAGAVVVLRGLTFEGLGTGLSAIKFFAGKALYVENCTINNFVQGIDIEPSADAALYVTNTVIRNLTNTSNGIFIAPAGAGSVEASLDTIQLLGNQNGLNVSGFSSVAVRNSVFARNMGNAVQAVGSSNINLESSTIANNQGNGVESGTGAQVRISNVMITNNSRGLLSSGGQIISFGNNRLGGNTINGAPTSTTAQQ